jgi:hypothetical protein
MSVALYAKNNKHGRFGTGLFFVGLFWIYEGHAPLEETNLSLTIDIIMECLGVGDGVN